MSVLSLYIPFSADDSAGISLGFVGARPEEAGRRMGELLDLSLTRSAAADGYFTDREAAGESILKKIYAGFDILRNDDGIVIRQLPGEQQAIYSGVLSLRQILPCAVRQGWYAGKPVALLHGVMLTHPAYPKEAVLLFGVSGMGKSTTAGRWRDSGGNAPADDSLLLFQDENGEFFARPLPTWSRYPESVVFRNCCHVKKILRLQRGDNNSIVPAADPVAWSVDCCKALMFHHGIPNLQPGESGYIARECMMFQENIRSKFRAFDLLADLHCDIGAALRPLFAE